MTLQGKLLVVAAALVMPVQAAPAPPTNHWRVFDAAAGLAETACETVTLGGSGNVLAQHPTTNVISVFDGYEVTIVPRAPGSHSRVYDSPGGQLWTLAPDGLLEFREGAWVHHPVVGIARQQQTGVTNDIPLLPVRQGQVLVLLADQLLAFSSGSSSGVRLEVIRRAEAAGLGEFKDMTAARDGGLWIVGSQGYAKVPGPIRNLHQNDLWAVFAGKPGELAQREMTLAGARENRTLHISDATVEPDGTLWLATPNGLMRHGPSSWQPAWASDVHKAGAEATVSSIVVGLDPVRAAEVLARSWQAGFVARNGDVWLGGAGEIAWRRKDHWRVFTSTNQIGPENVLEFVESPDGRICCSTRDKVWEFDGRNWLPMRGGFDHINALCFTRDGTLWVATDDGLHRCARGAWVENDRTDGLASDVVTEVYEDSSGRIHALTSGGINVFEPEADPDAPRTFIQPITLGEQAVREGAALRLAFGGRDRWNLTSSDRLLYSHRLDDREWSPFLEQSEVLFADLPVGQHYFQVRAMDRNANIDPKPARLEFVVALPWYRETRLVVVLAVALGIAIFFAGVALNRHRKLRLSYTEVERQVAERTAELELAQRELVHSQKMNALGTLAAGIAHDFNNILSIVKGSAQIIAENTDNPQKIRTRVDRIKTVVEQGAGIVTAMLGFSGSADEPPCPGDLNAIVDDTIRLLGDRFLHEVNVRFEPASDLPGIVSVKNLIQQILLNLIFNAAEAMTGNKQVTLCTRELSGIPEGAVLTPGAASRFVCVSVHDAGCGIAPEVLPRIFEPFFTTKALSTRRGTGLGLSMAYELAKKLGGGLAVESVVGQGSTFTLILPVGTESERT